jgi:hypothetical protein
MPWSWHAAKCVGAACATRKPCTPGKAAAMPATSIAVRIVDFARTELFSRRIYISVILRSGDLHAQFFWQPLPNFLWQMVMHAARALLGRIQHGDGRRSRHRHAQPD